MERSWESYSVFESIQPLGEVSLPTLHWPEQQVMPKRETDEGIINITRNLSSSQRITQEQVLCCCYSRVKRSCNSREKILGKEQTGLYPFQPLYHQTATFVFSFAIELQNATNI